MADAAHKPPAFYCPKCGQKHRADLSPLDGRPSGTVRTPCRRCGAALRIHLEDDRPVCEVIEVEPPQAAPKTEKPLAPGERVGRYKVKGVLRKGQTSTVYRAHDPTTKRSVALKVLRADATDAVRRCFLRQVDVQANIRHPDILPVYDRGTLEDGRPFFTMELVHRPMTLADVLARRADGTLEKERGMAPLQTFDGLVERVLLPIAEGIYVANVENGVLHDDLRPENVLVDGRTLMPYVLDFGHAVDLEGGGTGVPAPTSPYLSPERAHGRVHPRSDVWGLGALLHTMLVGAPPLEGQGKELRTNAAEGRYTAIGADAPSGLAAVARKAMARAPDARYVNARQLAADLKAWLGGGRIRAVEEFGGSGATAQETRRAVRQHLLTAAWVTAGLVVGLLVGSLIPRAEEDAGAARVAAVEQEVNRLDRHLTLIQPLAATLAPDDAHRVWSRLVERADGLVARLSKAPPSATRRAIEDRIAYVRGRMPTPTVRIDAPDGVEIEAKNLRSHERTRLTPPVASLPPGRYEIHVGSDERLRFLAEIPFRVRTAGQEDEGNLPCSLWSLPVAPSAIPRERVLVLGTSVCLTEFPFGEPTGKVTVTTFAMDRRPVSNADYALFLAALPDDERAAHVPSVGFAVDADGSHRPVRGAEKEPVAGVRPLDARGYCTWRSREEKASVRLPTEAEWVLASGGAWSDWPLGDLVEHTEGNPFGLEGMLLEPQEMATGIPELGHEESDTVARGPVSDTTPEGQARYEGRLLAGGRPDPTVGFRCVQDLTP